jgi:hypothetical protein
MSSATAATLQREALNPLLDAQALNDRHEQLLTDIAHDLNLVITRASNALSGTVRAVATGQLERDAVRRAAGFVDRQVTAHRDAERNGHSDSVPARQIAKDLRSALDAQSVDALAALVRHLNQPVDQLLAPAVRYQLGKRKTRLLEQLIQAVNDSGARALNSDAANHEGRSLDGQAGV